MVLYVVRNAETPFKEIKNKLSSSGPDHVHVQVMSRSCPGHVQVISYPSPSQISRDGPGADSIIAMSPPTHHQETFLSEITQISLQEVNH